MSLQAHASPSALTYMEASPSPLTAVEMHCNCLCMLGYTAANTGWGKRGVALNNFAFVTFLSTTQILIKLCWCQLWKYYSHDGTQDEAITKITVQKNCLNIEQGF